MDVGIIMDRSGSVGSANFKKSKDFVSTLVDRLKISSHETRVGIIAYHSSSHLAVKFADVNSQSQAAMDNIINRYILFPIFLTDIVSTPTYFS